MGYREQPSKLMTNLRNTKPHFVRCIIPNEKKKCGEVEPELVLAQLRCNGVLEGIRICRKGFPNRLQYPEFKQRYQILAAKKVAKIVFKAGTLADLEDKRDEILSRIMTKLQSRARGKLMRIEYTKMIARVRAARCIQTTLRNFVPFRDWHW